MPPHRGGRRRICRRCAHRPGAAPGGPRRARSCWSAPNRTCRTTNRRCPSSSSLERGTLERVSLAHRGGGGLARIELRLGVAAVRLDVAGHAVVLADGSRISYDVVVLATGAAARPSPWHPESGLYIVRAPRRRPSLCRPRWPSVHRAGRRRRRRVHRRRGRGHRARCRTPGHRRRPAGRLPIGRVLGDEIGALFGHGAHAPRRRHPLRHRACRTSPAGPETCRSTLTDGEVLPADSSSSASAPPQRRTG